MIVEERAGIRKKEEGKLKNARGGKEKRKKIGRKVRKCR
jgi:hypothetical protein